MLSNRKAEIVGEGAIIAKKQASIKKE